MLHYSRFALVAIVGAAVCAGLVAIPITQGIWTAPLLSWTLVCLNAGLLLAGFDALHQLDALDTLQGNPFVGGGAVLLLASALLGAIEPANDAVSLLVLFTAYSTLLLGWLGREHALRTEDEPAPAS